VTVAMAAVMTANKDAHILLIIAYYSFWWIFYVWTFVFCGDLPLNFLYGSSLELLWNFLRILPDLSAENDVLSSQLLQN
jgi:hypothetical protein